MSFWLPALPSPQKQAIQALGLWDELAEQNRSIPVWVSFREGCRHLFDHKTRPW